MKRKKLKLVALFTTVLIISHLITFSALAAAPSYGTFVQSVQTPQTITQSQYTEVAEAAKGRIPTLLRHMTVSVTPTQAQTTMTVHSPTLHTNPDHIKSSSTVLTPPDKKFPVS